MALRIGKKKAAETTETTATVGAVPEDFRDFGHQEMQATPGNSAVDTVPIGETAFDTTTYTTTNEPNFNYDTVPVDTAQIDTTQTTTHSEYVAPPAYPQTVHTETIHTEEVPVVVTKKKVPLPALLGLGALGLLGLGALAWSKMAPKEETEDAPIMVHHAAPKPTPAKVAPVKVIVVKGAPVKPLVKVPVVKTATKTVTTQTTAKTVAATPANATAPGAPATTATTTTTQTTVATAVVPDPRAAAATIAAGPRVAIPVDQPAPSVFPPPAARPGKWADPNEVTVAKSAQIVPVVAPAVKARLKSLWKQGADAKHRKDYAGARRAWSEALKLAPGYPGFADSIAKLPRRS